MKKKPGCPECYGVGEEFCQCGYGPDALSLTEEDLDKMKVEAIRGASGVIGHFMNEFPVSQQYMLITQARQAIRLAQHIKKLEESRDKAYTIGRHDGMRTAARLVFVPFEHAKVQCDKIIEVFRKAGE